MLRLPLSTAPEMQLYYDNQDPDTRRHSISLDFHISTIIDDDLDVFSIPQLDECQLRELTLAKLVTKLPIHDYVNNFHHLLFEDKSFDKMLVVLGSLSVPCQTPHLAALQNTALQRRYRAWQRDNEATIPRKIRAIQSDILISGTYDSPDGFIDNVVCKALRDVHLPIGMDIVPQLPTDAQHEYARKYIRNQPAEAVYRKLVQYVQFLTIRSYTSTDLLSTSKIREIGSILEKRCLELISADLVDSACLLPAVGSLSCTLGDALDSMKEVSASLEPWVTDEDLQIFRTRCIYLFWCTDWLARYLATPKRGPMMIRDVRRDEIANIREEATYIARLLLRNWVAWGLFVESLPKGGFKVRGLSGYEM
jgi:hypothetical protein